MPEVTVRDAHRGDARAIAEVWAAAVPTAVRSSARAVADLREDRGLARRRWVAMIEGEVAGTATARLLHGETPHARREVMLGVEVHPDLGSRGVGTALLAAASAGVPNVDQLHAVCCEDPISMAFGVRFGFVPQGEEHVAAVTTADVGPAGPTPSGLRAVTLDRISDLHMLLDTYNLAVREDPSGVSQPMTMKQLRVEWWGSPDHAADLSWGLVADSPTAPLLTSFTSVRVDRERGRSWSNVTATDPSYRRRGLATWVKRRMLQSLQAAGLDEAWTAVDTDNAAMRAVNDALGYRHVGGFVHVSRRLRR